MAEMNAWDEAVEAGYEAAGGDDGRITRGDVEDVLNAALPILLADLARDIRAKADAEWKTGYPAHSSGMDHAADMVDEAIRAWKSSAT